MRLNFGKYRVRFRDKESGKGFIERFTTARAARKAVEVTNLSTPKTQMEAEYLGREK